jgi:hypothetical protein
MLGSDYNLFYSWLERWSLHWWSLSASWWCPIIFSLAWHKLARSEDLVDRFIFDFHIAISPLFWVILWTSW